MTIDVLASQTHFVDHLAPVWAALPEEERGTFYYIGHAQPRAVEGMVYARKPPQSSGPTLVASSSDLLLSRRLGRPSAIMEHGCGQSFGGDPRRGGTSPSYAGGRGRDAQLFLHPGPHPAGRDRARYPNARVEIVGCPKLDSLPRKRSRSRVPVVAVSFHWDCHVSPETRSAFAQFCSQVGRLAKKDDTIRMIGHGHPRILGTAKEPLALARWYARQGIEILYSFEDVCRKADLYVNDASSTLFEFASTGRPVIAMNPDWYRRKINHGLRFWEASTVGVNIGPKDSLRDAISAALADPPEQQERREAALDLVYAYRKGSAERAAAALVDWAAG